MTKNNILYLIIFSIITFGCSDCEHNNKCNYNENTQYNYQKQELVKEYCYKCHGTGKVEMSTGGKICFGIITLGHGLMCDLTTECDICKGTGIIYKPKL